jgi:hypothetical protein
VGGFGPDDAERIQDFALIGPHLAPALASAGFTGGSSTTSPGMTGGNETFT